MSFTVHDISFRRANLPESSFAYHTKKHLPEPRLTVTRYAYGAGVAEVISFEMNYDDPTEHAVPGVLCVSNVSFLIMFSLSSWVISFLRLIGVLANVGPYRSNGTCGKGTGIRRGNCIQRCGKWRNLLGLAQYTNWRRNAWFTGGPYSKRYRQGVQMPFI